MWFLPLFCHCPALLSKPDSGPSGPASLHGAAHWLTGENSGNPVAAAFFFAMEVGKTYNKLGDKIFNDEFSNDIHI